MSHQEGQSSDNEEANNLSFAHAFAKGSIWTIIGIVGSRFSNFFAMVIAARILGQVAFGELGIIQRTLDLAISFGMLGVGLTTTKYVAELKDRDPHRVSRIISLTYAIAWISGIALALVFLLGAPWLAKKTINAPHLINELRLMGFVLMLTVVSRLQNGILSGFHSFKSIALLNWWEGLVFFPFMALLTWQGGLWGAILAIAFTALFRFLSSCWVLAPHYRRHGIRIKWREGWKERSVFWQFSFPAFLFGGIGPLANWIAYAILAYQPGGYAQLGLFTAALQFQWVITAINLVMSQVSVPMLAKVYGDGQQEKFSRTSNIYIKINWNFSLGGGFLLLGLSPWLVQIFGKQFQDSSQVLGHVISFSVIMLGWHLALQPFISAGKMWHALGIQTFWCVIMLIFCKLLIPSLRAIGLADAYLIAYSLSFLLEVLLMKFIFGNNFIAGLGFSILLAISLVGSMLIQSSINHVFFNILLIVVSIIIIIKLIYDYRHVLKNNISFIVESFNRSIHNALKKCMKYLAY